MRQETGHFEDWGLLALECLECMTGTKTDSPAVPCLCVAPGLPSTTSPCPSLPFPSLSVPVFPHPLPGPSSFPCLPDTTGTALPPSPSLHDLLPHPFASLSTHLHTPSHLGGSISMFLLQQVLGFHFSFCYMPALPAGGLCPSLAQHIPATRAMLPCRCTRLRRWLGLSPRLHARPAFLCLFLHFRLHLWTRQVWQPCR